MCKKNCTFAAIFRETGIFELEINNLNSDD